MSNILEILETKFNEWCAACDMTDGSTKINPVFVLSGNHGIGKTFWIQDRLRGTDNVAYNPTNSTLLKDIKRGFVVYDGERSVDLVPNLPGIAFIVLVNQPHREVVSVNLEDNKLF